MKLTISGKVFINDKDKSGNPFISKAGKPYKKIAFKVHEEVMGNVGKYLSGFYSDAMDEWEDGTIIDVDVEVKGEYLNFSLPKKTVSREEFDEFVETTEQNFQQLWNAINKFTPKEKVSFTPSIADPVEDLPF